jgi:hypothetical protein
MIERVRALREQGRTPKQIARTLGMEPAAVAPLIRTVAAAQPAREAALIGCWVNQGWAAGLTVTGHPEWPGYGVTAESGPSGLVNVLVVREKGGSAVVCGYMVDVWCLGVKDALGPKSVDRRKLSEFTRTYFTSYEQPPLAIPLDLAKQLVFGAVSYARELGFEPHADFAGCTSHDAQRIIRTLRRAVGKGNFSATVAG